MRWKCTFRSCVSQSRITCIRVAYFKANAAILLLHTGNFTFWWNPNRCDAQLLVLLSNGTSRTLAATLRQQLRFALRRNQLSWRRYDRWRRLFFRGWLAYFCLFALHLPSLHPLVGVPQRARPCLTRHRAFFLFLWRRCSQAEYIRLRSKRKGKEKEPTGASWGKDCISSHELQDRRTGQHASKTDSLPLVHAETVMTHHSSIYTYTHISFPLKAHAHYPFLYHINLYVPHPANKHYYMHSFRYYLCDTGLEGET